MGFGTLLFVIGRFLGTFLMSYFKDHRLLGIYGVVAILLSLGGVWLDGKIAVYSILTINLFMSIMFPTIFALGVRGIGEHTKLGSSLIIMAIVGGAIIPPLMGVIADNIGIQQSFWIPAFCFIAVAFYGFVGYKQKESVQAVL